MHPPLTGHYSSHEEVPDHSWSVQAGPVDQVHQLRYLTGVLRPICPADPVLRNISNITKSSAARFFPNVEPPLVPLCERGVPRAIEVTVFHSVMEIEVYSTFNLGASYRSILPQAEQIAEEIKVRLYPDIGLAQVNKSRNKKNRVWVQVANPELIV